MNRRRSTPAGSARAPGLVVTDFLAALDARDIAGACAHLAPGVTVTALGQTHAGREAVAGALAAAGEVFGDSRVVARATDVTRTQVRTDVIVAVRSATSVNTQWVVSSGYLTAAVAAGSIENLVVTLDSDAIRAQLAGTPMAAGSLRSELALIGFDPDVRPETDVRVVEVPPTNAATSRGRRRAAGIAAALVALGLATTGLALTASDPAQTAAPTATPSSSASEEAVAPSPSPSPSPAESNPEPEPAATTLLGPEATERPDGSITTALSGTVLFERDSAVLRPEARTTIRDLATSLSSAQGGTLELVGYTDNLGSAARGRELSLQRARAVAAIFRESLADTGITVTATGRGEADPVAPNDTEANRARNRRVEVIYTP